MLTVLRNADVYTPERLGRRDLLVAAGQLVAIEPELPELPRAVVREELDLGGARVIPGLVDGHVHVTGGGGESGPASRVPPIQLSAITRAGITTVVGLLGTDGTTRSVADLVARTLGLREEGLSAWCWTGSYELPLKTLTGAVRSDVTFVDPIIGVGELAISDHRSSQPTLDELLRIASDCHVSGLMTGKAGILHLHLGDGPRGLELVRRALEISELPARVFHPTHVNRNHRLFEEAKALAKSRGITIDVTAFPADDESWSAAEAIARCLSDPEFPADKLTVSSDGAGCLPVFDADGRLVEMDIGRPAGVAEALRELLARGFALERVLPVFTSNAAKLLRLPGKGVLTAGADADLVVLDDDANVRHVLARGRWLLRDHEPVVFGRYERALAR